MLGYYYLVSYDYNIKDSETLGGHCILLKDEKISQNKYPPRVIEGIIDLIKANLQKNLQETCSELNGLVKRDDIKVVLRNLQLIE